MKRKRIKPNLILTPFGLGVVAVVMFLICFLGVML